MILTHNVPGLGEGVEIEAQMFKLALKPHFCKTAVSGSAFIFEVF